MADPRQRLLLTEEQFRSLPSAAAVQDERRSRTLWFDGMFVTAKHFLRDQAYFLTRQADLALAAGAGVVSGLDVRPDGDSATRLVITAGHGVAASGDPVVLPGDMIVDLAELPGQRQLNGALGLGSEPSAPLATRSGLFVLALRPLEFTSDPTTAYPTSLESDERRLMDGVVNEAVLVTLVPFALSGLTEDAGLRRAAVAAAVFGGEREIELPPTALPLAMVEIAGNTLVWLDVDLARREASLHHADLLGLGLAPYARRSAHLRQYESMLAGIVAERLADGASAAFAAIDRFLALPAAGRMPAASLAFTADPVTGERVLAQSFFPGAIPLELSILPEDELPALIEESLVLPPIRLDAPEAELEAGPVTVHVPIARADLDDTVRTLAALPRPLPPRHRFPRLPLRPVDMLRALAESSSPPAVLPEADIGDAAWERLIAGRSFLWYARSRRIAARIDLLGMIRLEPEPAPEPAPPDDDEEPPDDGDEDDDDTPPPDDDEEPPPEEDDPRLDRNALERRVRERLATIEAALATRLVAMRPAASEAGRRAMHELVDMGLDTEHELAIRGVMHELEAATPIRQPGVQTIARRFSAETLEQGLPRVETAILSTVSPPGGGDDEWVLLTLVRIGPNPDAVLRVLTNVLGIEVAGGVQALGRLPLQLPRRFTPDEAVMIERRLRQAGAEVMSERRTGPLPRPRPGDPFPIPRDLIPVPRDTIPIPGEPRPRPSDPTLPPGRQLTELPSTLREEIAGSRRVSELALFGVQASNALLHEFAKRFVDLFPELFLPGSMHDEIAELVLEFHGRL